MPLLGSFCLLFSLALALYCFGAGVLSLLRRTPATARLGETSRRAGLACFIALCGAGFALVYAALTNDFSVDYIHAHTNRGWCVVGQRGSGSSDR